MKIEILAIGRNDEIMQTLLRLIRKNEYWNASGALTDEEAVTIFDQVNPDIVLLSNGIDDTCENKLCSYFRSKNPGIIIIQHYGGGSGLLNNEILHALNTKKKIKEEQR
jgi:DNA-binding response OmpR family regulator